MLLKLSLTAPAPKDPALRKEMTTIGVSLDSDYGKGKYCRKNGECLDITAIEKIMASSRNPEELKELWTGWHSFLRRCGRAIRVLSSFRTRGAREMGFKDVGALWRGGYDMTPDEFSADLERLWNQVRPLYLSLHTFVRAKLVEKYGRASSRRMGRFPRICSATSGRRSGAMSTTSPELKKTRAESTSPNCSRKRISMQGHGEVWRGLLYFARIRQAPANILGAVALYEAGRSRCVCHASAWDIDNKDDLRIKMCIQVRGEDFVTIHHELGHNFYQRAYKNQPPLFQNGANDGFHEAIGDAIALAITPEYLHKVGLLENVPQGTNDVPELLKQALDRVAFLPFGLLIDQWRWKVFSGEIKPADYNKAWWDLRLKYQGVAPPVARSEADFDAARSIT